MAPSTEAGVGRELKMLGTYLVNSCSGGLPAAVHCCWKSPRMPGTAVENKSGRIHVHHYAPHRNLEVLDN